MEATNFAHGNVSTAANSTKISVPGEICRIIDATLVAARRQRNADEEKAAIKAGELPMEWKDKPVKLAQKDRDARWTVKYSKAKPKEDETKPRSIVIPYFGYKNHISIDCRYGIIRREMTMERGCARD